MLKTSDQIILRVNCDVGVDWVVVSQTKRHCTARFRCLMSHVYSSFLFTALLPSRRAFTSVRALVHSELRLCLPVCGNASKRGFADEMAYQSRLFQVHCRLCEALAGGKLVP